MERKDVIKMGTTIKIKCIDQTLTYEGTPVVASGGLFSEGNFSYPLKTDTGKIQGAQTHSNIYQEIEINESITSAVRRCPKKSLIGIHNHPESSTPSGGDYESFYVRGYSQAFIVCHNGDLYEYHAGKKKFTGTRVDLEIAKWKKDYILKMKHMKKP